MTAAETPSIALPDERLVTTLDVLARFSGRPVYLHEVAGNNGDELILKGSEFLIHQAGCVLVDEPSQAEVLLINGGFKSDFWPFANETIRDFSQRFPDTPLVILPSSFLYETTDFVGLFAGRRAAATIIARELPSLEILRSMRFESSIELGLDHDTAFALAESERFKTLAATTPDRDVLIVERADAESPTGLSESGMLESGIILSVANAVLPRSVAMAGARIIRKARGRRPRPASRFVEKVPAMIEERHPDLNVESQLVADISRRSMCDFNGFCEEIARSSVVISTRLHVAILAANMGRETYIVAGKYHKIPGIYEYSMKDMEHVAMVDTECRVIA